MEIELTASPTEICKSSISIPIPAILEITSFAGTRSLKERRILLVDWSPVDLDFERFD
jgi:hypothetical protein